MTNKKLSVETSVCFLVQMTLKSRLLWLCVRSSLQDVLSLLFIDTTGPNMEQCI